jgi:hypothetical protein
MAVVAAVVVAVVAAVVVAGVGWRVIRAQLDVVVGEASIVAGHCHTLTAAAMCSTVADGASAAEWRLTGCGGASPTRRLFGFDCGVASATSGTSTSSSSDITAVGVQPLQYTAQFRNSVQAQVRFIRLIRLIDSNVHVQEVSAFGGDTVRSRAHTHTRTHATAVLAALPPFFHDDATS